MGPYKRKTNRVLRFTEEILQKMRPELNNRVSKRGLAKEYGVSESGLRKRLKVGTVPASLGRYRPVFSEEMESDLAEQIQNMDKLFYGLTYKDLQAVAYKYAEMSKIEHPFNKTTQLAGKKWIQMFCKKHNLSVRQPEKVTLARAVGFNKTQVSRFFDNLKTCIEKHKFCAKSIFNMDETGMLTVPNKIPKVVTTKGKKCVGKIVSGERGQLITAVCCVSASGIYVPTALIFPRKREKQELLYGAPSGTILMLSDSGFINTELFLKWLEHFKAHVKPSKEEPVLLLLDNHSSHISLQAVTFCRESGIHLLSLPPHSSHKLQPLDVGFFGPLKTAYGQEADKWMVSNAGKTITQFQIASLFGKAYSRIASIEKAEKSFLSTGIWPFNPDIFMDEDFAPASVTDTPAPVNDNPTQPQSNVNVQNVEIVVDDPELLEIINNGEFSTVHADENMPEALELTATELHASSTKQFQQTENEQHPSVHVAATNAPVTPQPSTSASENIQGMEETDDTALYYIPELLGQSSSSSLLLTHEEMISPSTSKEILNYSKEVIEKVCPLPKATRSEPKRKRLCKKSEIITSTPFKDSLVNNEAEADKKQTKVGKAKRKITKPARGKNALNKKAKNTKKVEPCGTCPACNETYSDPPETDLIECSMCRKWFHEICTSYEGVGLFQCDICQV